MRTEAPKGWLGTGWGVQAARARSRTRSRVWDALRAGTGRESNSLVLELLASMNPPLHPASLASPKIPMNNIQ